MFVLNKNLPWGALVTKVVSQSVRLEELNTWKVRLVGPLTRVVKVPPGNRVGAEKSGGAKCATPIGGREFGPAAIVAEAAGAHSKPWSVRLSLPKHFTFRVHGPLTALA